MSDPSGSEPALRGEAAWKAHREAISQRNDKAKKVGKERHDAWEQLRRQSRADAEAREDVRFLSRQRGD